MRLLRPVPVVAIVQSKLFQKQTVVGVAVSVLTHQLGGQPDFCTMCQVRACADRRLYCMKLVG